MKNLLMNLALVIVLVLGSVTSVQALPFPDPAHPPLAIGPADVDLGMPSDTFEGSYMFSKAFTVPSGGVTVLFDYNFLTDEFYWDDDQGEWVPDVNDYFGVALLDPSSDSGPVEFYYVADVYTSTFFPIIGDEGTTGPHGSYFTYETGVLPGSLTISSAYGGSDMALAFAVFDLDDEIVDSGILIDDISLPVPYGNFDGGLLGPTGFIGDNDGWDLYGGNIHMLPDGSLPGVDTTGFEGNYAYLSTGPGAMMIPEPATLLLLGSGLLGMMALRKRKG